MSGGQTALHLAQTQVPKVRNENYYKENKGFSGSSAVKDSACNGDVGSIPGSGRLPREGTDNPLQYSCLGNPMDRGAGLEIAKSQILFSD